ncbi:DUF4272 domain-containing protein [Rapidithrix thailandica]|uniref:DUF4272 domain-containing protein n=1 Tax=Rapidithrix thailandica TaxID=413964 RepID=A0AAW9RYH2_9BACT
MENYCTLYAHELALEKIIEEINTRFPNEEISYSESGETKSISVNTNNGLTGAKSQFQINYRERAKPSYKIEQIDSSLTQNLSGMLGFVNSLSSQNEEVKYLLMRKIETLNCEFSILTSINDFPELISLIKALSQALDVIVFARPDTVISRSDTQHFLDKDLALILDMNGNNEISELKVNILTKYHDKPQENATEMQVERKKNSESILMAQQVKVNSNLPYIPSDENVSIRSVEKIAERVVMLATTNMVAFNAISGEQAKEYLNGYKLLDKATPKELDFLNNPTEEKKNYETWKCEGIWVLMWALGIVEDLAFPNHMADLNAIPSEQYPIGSDTDPNSFIQSAKVPRSKKAILDANDLYYRIDWACVDARINGQEMQAVHPGVVYERHYALNWLIKYNNQEWDEVTCDT